MINFIRLLISRGVFIALLVSGGLFFIFKNVLYAADDMNVAGLQHEIILAKEKHENISQKMDLVYQALESQRSIQLRQDAENLMAEITRDGYKSLDIKPASYSAGARPEPSPVPPPVIGSDTHSGASLFELALSPEKEKERLKKIEPKKPWVLMPFPRIFGTQEKRYGDRISESEALYKVAVSDGKVTMEEAVQIGVSNSIALKGLKKKIEVADAKWTEAKRAMFPTVQLQYDANGGHSPTGQRFYKGRAFKVNVNQPLYYGGELILTAKQAEEGVLVAKSEYFKSKNELIQEIRGAYYGVVKAEYNAQYQMDLLKEIQEFYKINRAAYAQKLLAEVDFLNVESQYQQVIFSVDSTQNDLMVAHLALKQSLNLDSVVELPIDLRLTLKKINPDFTVLLNLALENNPDIRMKQLQYISAQDGVAIYKAKKMPRFDLRGSIGKLGEAFKDTEAIEDGEHNIDPEREWFLGVKGSMPLGANSVEYEQIKHVYGPTVSAFQGSDDWRHTGRFNLLDRFSDITDTKNAEATLLQAEADWQKAKVELVTKLKEAYYDLQKSMIQMDASIAKIRYQDKQNAILKFTVGMQEAQPASFLEGLIEQPSNRFAFIQAVADYNSAVSNLGVLVGDPYYFEDKANA